MCIAAAAPADNQSGAIGPRRRQGTPNRISNELETVHPPQEAQEEECVGEIGRVENMKETADAKALQEEREPDRQAASSQRRHDHAREGGHRERQREQAANVGREQECVDCTDEKKKVPGCEKEVPGGVERKKLGLEGQAIMRSNYLTA